MLIKKKTAFLGRHKNMRIYKLCKFKSNLEIPTPGHSRAVTFSSKQTILPLILPTRFSPKHMRSKHTIQNYNNTMFLM